MLLRSNVIAGLVCACSDIWRPGDKRTAEYSGQETGGDYEPEKILHQRKAGSGMQLLVKWVVSLLPRRSVAPAGCMTCPACEPCAVCMPIVHVLNAHPCWLLNIFWGQFASG